MRMNAGAPTSLGTVLVQPSTGAQSLTSTGAQIKFLEPSKSPACATLATRSAPPQRASCAMRLPARSNLFDDIAASFHACRECLVVVRHSPLGLLLRLLLLLRLGAGVAPLPGAAGHRSYDRA